MGLVAVGDRKEREAVEADADHVRMMVRVQPDDDRVGLAYFAVLDRYLVVAAPEVEVLALGVLRLGGAGREDGEGGEDEGGGRSRVPVPFHAGSLSLEGGAVEHPAVGGPAERLERMRLGELLAETAERSRLDPRMRRRAVAVPFEMYPMASA